MSGPYKEYSTNWPICTSRLAKINSQVSLGSVCVTVRHEPLYLQLPIRLTNRQKYFFVPLIPPAEVTKNCGWKGRYVFIVRDSILSGHIFLARLLTANQEYHFMHTWRLQNIKNVRFVGSTFFSFCEKVCLFVTSELQKPWLDFKIIFRIS